MKCFLLHFDSCNSFVDLPLFFLLPLWQNSLKICDILSFYPGRHHRGDRCDGCFRRSESEKPKTLLHKLQSSTGSSSYVYMKNQVWLVSAGLCDSDFWFWDAPCLQKIKSFPPNQIRHVSRGYETCSQAYIKMPSSSLTNLFEWKNTNS